MECAIVIPAFNEAAALRGVLEELVTYLGQQRIAAQVIVVDDGSSDRTAEEALAVPGVRLIRHPYNKGYGAALKTGIQAAQTEWCITYDADRQHTPDLISLFLPFLTDGNDMVVGKREGYRGPWIRQPGKKLISFVANYVTERKIPDLNSGLRAFRRAAFLRYMHLFPNGFSLSTTSTVCFFKENLNVVYVPIRIRERVGKSTVRPRDFGKTLMLVLRIIMLFSPLRIFLPACFFFALLTVADIALEYAMTKSIANQSAVALVSLASLTFFFGLLADQIAAIRREHLRQAS
ncbi:MAG: glycosyltransferase family 2 protein [Candidatus Peribacteraceae bacterium]|jgi:glycosyltransferase involved in cell wall biosynthesis